MKLDPFSKVISSLELAIQQEKNESIRQLETK